MIPKDDVVGKMSDMKNRGKEPRTAGVLDFWIDEIDCSED